MRGKFSLIEDARRPARRREQDGKRDALSGNASECGRRPKRKRALFRRSRRFLLLPAAAILVFLLFRLFPDSGAAEDPGGKSAFLFTARDPSSLSGRDGEEESSPRPIPAEEQDPLLLVNRDHPLPRDYVPETAALRNGMAASRLCLDDLQDMMDDCRAAGLRPLICSSYRPYEKQEELHLAKVRFYQGQGKLPGEAVALASQVVAPAGESEHQTGLAFDIVDEGYQLLDEKQETTAVSLWLRENAARYGFVVRYPPDKTDVTGIIYEPWHYRYVGKENAAAMTSAGWTLEEYLKNAPGS